MVAGEVDGAFPCAALIAGVLRGIPPDEYAAGDERHEEPATSTRAAERGSTAIAASDKAIAVGGGVLQAILEYSVC